jgi:hypothetical protein
MIEMRRAQLSFGDGLIAEEVSDLREDWMNRADAVLADESGQLHPPSLQCRPLWYTGEQHVGRFE